MDIIPENELIDLKIKIEKGIQRFEFPEIYKRNSLKSKSLLVSVRVT